MEEERPYVGYNPNLEQAPCMFCDGRGRFPGFRTPSSSSSSSARKEPDILLCPACNGYGYIFRQKGERDEPLD